MTSTVACAGAGTRVLSSIKNRIVGVPAEERGKRQGQNSKVPGGLLCCAPPDFAWICSPAYARKLSCPQYRPKASSGENTPTKDGACKPCTVSSPDHSSCPQSVALSDGETGTTPRETTVCRGTFPESATPTRLLPHSHPTGPGTVSAPPSQQNMFCMSDPPTMVARGQNSCSVCTMRSRPDNGVYDDETDDAFRYHGGTRRRR